MPSSPQNVQSTQNSQPWQPQGNHLQEIWNQADVLQNTPDKFFPGSTVVPLSGQTQQALGLQEQRALSGSPLVQQAQQNVGASLRGELNPALQAQMGNVMQQVKGQVNPIFAQSNRGLSGAHANALTSAMTNAGTQLAYQDYNNAQQQAIPLANQDYFDPGQLANVGQVYESQAGANIQDQMQRFNFEQQAPWNALRNYAALVSGGSVGGTTTTNQPIYSNPLMTAAGLGLGAGSTAGSLFGGGGLFAKGGIFGS